MTIHPAVRADELDALLTTFEAEPKGVLGPSDDTVNFLWRRELENITYHAIDGIGDEEDTGEALVEHDDFGSAVADILARIKDPAPSLGGQSYAFVVDADVKLSEHDLHYETSTVHRSFEENPTLLTLSQEEAVRIREESTTAADNLILERFLEVLLFVVMHPARRIAPESLEAVFVKLFESSWNAGDFPALQQLMTRLDGASRSAPDAAGREIARGIVTRFLSTERLRATFAAVQQGTMSLATGEILWNLAGDPAWHLLLEVWASLTDDAPRKSLAELFRKRLRTSPEFLRAPLSSSNTTVARAALAMLDETTEPLYIRELVGLAESEDENLRIRGLASARRFLKGPEMLELLWHAMEKDTSKSVRLFAFRSMATTRLPGLRERLGKLVREPSFHERPLWERDKYIRLLASVAGDAEHGLFLSWLPGKKWFWSQKELEFAELALDGLAATGEKGLEVVRSWLAKGGKVGELAKKALETASRGATTQVPAPPKRDG